MPAWFDRIWDAVSTKSSAAARAIALTSNNIAIWTPRNYEMLSREGYQKNSIAYRCVDEIAKGVSQTPFLVYKRNADGTRTEVPNHPVARLLRRPNPSQGRGELMYELASFLVISGNAYLEAVGPRTGPNAGNPRELWTKRPDRMKIVPGPMGISRYEHEVNGVINTWEVNPVTQKSGIVHVKLFHPTNDWYGLSPIEVAAMDIDTHNQTKEWNKGLLDNAARPEGALVTEKALADTQFKRLKTQLIEDHAGSKNAGRPMLLENGLQWVPFSFSPKDMDFLESKNTSARDVCSAFGVPPMLLAIPGDNTYSNQREARLAFFDITITFYLQLITDKLNAGLLEQDSEFEIDYDLDRVPAMALRREQMFERAEKANFITMDEKRWLTGFGKLPTNGDVVLVGTDQRPLEHAMIKEPDALEVAKAQGEAQIAVEKSKPKPAPAAKPAATPLRAISGGKKHLEDVATAARQELGLDKVQFTAWLINKGLNETEAAELAELTDAA